MSPDDTDVHQYVEEEQIPNVGFTDLIGLDFGDVTKQRVTATLDVESRHHQPLGVLHGGVHCTIVESLASVGGFLNVHEDGNTVVGVSNATDFLRPVTEGTIRGVATPIHLGRTQHLWQVVITRVSDGEPVARGQVRLQVIPMDR